MNYLSFFSVLLFCTTGLYAEGICFSQAGSQLGDHIQPCNSTGNPGACCGIGSGDICTSNGLCLRQGDLPGFFYQDGCIANDPSDSRCPQFCRGNTDQAWTLQQCSDSVSPGTWCCKRPGEGDCCTKSTMTTNVGTLILSTNAPATTVLTGSGIVTTTATITASPTGASGAQPSTCPKDSTAVVGAGIGASLGVAFLASLGMLFWRERTRPKVSKDGASQEFLNSNALLGDGKSAGVGQLPEYYQGRAQVHELQTSPVVAQLHS